MFEREIQFIYDFSHNKIKRLGTFITYEQLKSTDIHPAILQYISGEIDFYIFEDRQKLLKESLFDYSGEKINNYFSLISSEIKKEKRFSQNFIEKLILHAVTFTVNYLAAPNNLISQFIFEEEREKSSAEIKQILNYLYFYPHIKKIVPAYLDKKSLLKISKDQFDDLLIKIDSIGLESNVNNLIDEALNSMADFLNIGISKQHAIPKSIVESYLKEKSLTEFSNKLEASFVDPEISKYDIQDYKKILLSIDTKKEDILEVQSDANVFEEEGDKKTDIGIFEEVESESNDDDDDEIRSEEVPSEIDSYISSEEDDETAEEYQSDDSSFDDIYETERSESEESDHEVIDSDETMTYEKDDETEEKDETETEKIDGDTAEEESDIAEIEDEREVESESVSEVMEFAKEEIEIKNLRDDKLDDYIEDSSDDKMTIDDSSDDEITFEEDEDESDSLETEKEKIEDEDSVEDEELDEARNLYLQETESEEEIEEAQETEVSNHDDPARDYEQDKELDGDFTGERDIDFEEDEQELEHDDPTGEDADDTGNSHLEIADITSEESEIDYDEQTLSEEPIAEDDESVSESLNDSSGEIPETEFEKEEEPIQEEESDEELSLFTGEKKLEDTADLDSENDLGNSVEEDLSEAEETPKFDITRLLENKKMRKIIDVIFDFDMEEFANSIEKIIESGSKENAIDIIDNICETSQIKPTSKEAKIFKSIISEYFDHH